MIDAAEEARLAPGQEAPPYVTVLNPLSADRRTSSRTLLPGLLNTARANLRFRDRVAIFELGRIFVPRPGGAAPGRTA